MVLTSPPAPQPSRQRPGELEQEERGVVAAAAAAAGGGQGERRPGSEEDVYEETHVHGVYEAIASHFSATRHKPWPFVSSFLASQPAGSVGLDVGCGNGKNMGVNRDVVMLGCDRSAALVALARDSWCSGLIINSRNSRNSSKTAGEGGKDNDNDGTNNDINTNTNTNTNNPGVIQGADVAVADSLVLPFREAAADFAICIAVIHHLSTRERRVDAIRQLLRCIRRGDEEGPGGDGNDAAGGEQRGSGSGSGGGKVLVYVWALEQSSSRRGWDEGGEQDLLVPWVMKAPPQKKEKKDKKDKNKNKAKMKGQKSKQVQQQEQGHGQGQGQGQGPEPASQGVQNKAAGVSSKGEEEEEGAGDVGSTNGRSDSPRDRSGSGEGGEKPRDQQQQQQQQQQQEEGKQQQEIQQQKQQGQQQGRREADADAAATAAAGTAEHASDHSNKQQQQQQEDRQQADKTFHRYYHLYKKGELEEEVLAAGGKVINSGYERDNWWVIAG